MVFSFSSCPVDKNVHEDYILVYSVHGDDMGCISGDDGDKRRDIIFYKSDEGGDISVDCVRRGY